MKSKVLSWNIVLLITVTSWGCFNEQAEEAKLKAVVLKKRLEMERNGGVGSVEWLNKVYQDQANLAHELFTMQDDSHRRADSLQVLVGRLQKQLADVEAKYERWDESASGMTLAAHLKWDKLNLGWWLSKGDRGTGWLVVCPKDQRTIRGASPKADDYLVGLWRQALNLKVELARNSPCE